jgi:hypothetical protein
MIWIQPDLDSDDMLICPEEILNSKPCRSKICGVLLSGGLKKRKEKGFSNICFGRNFLY